MHTGSMEFFPILGNHIVNTLKRTSERKGMGIASECAAFLSGQAQKATFRSLTALEASSRRNKDLRAMIREEYRRSQECKRDKIRLRVEFGAVSNETVGN